MADYVRDGTRDRAGAAGGFLPLELCGGGAFAAWKGCLDDLVARGLLASVLASSTAMPACGAPSGSCGPGPRSNAVVSISCATFSAKRSRMCWPRSATISTGSSMRPMPTRPAPPTRSSSARGPNVAQG